MIQEIIALMIVFAAVIYAIRQVLKFFSPSDKSSASPCAHCPLADRKNCSDNTQ